MKFRSRNLRTTDVEDVEIELDHLPCDWLDSHSCKIGERVIVAYNVLDNDYRSADDMMGDCMGRIVDGAPLLAELLARELQRPVLIGPDAESAQWIAQAAARHGSDYGVCRKVRHGDRAVCIELPSVPVAGRAVVATIGPGGAVISETVVFQDIGRGFFATPRLNGEWVTIDISQQADSVARFGPPGSVSTQSLSTTVSGRLGEWIELGGTSRQVSGNQTGSFGRSTSGGQDARSIWLLVEEVQ